MIKNIEGTKANEITCPHCGHVTEDSWEWAEYGDIKCVNCDNEFSYERNTDITYYSRKKSEMSKDELIRFKKWSATIDMINLANIIFSKNEKKGFIKLIESMGYEAKICSECGQIMIQGYCIAGGEAYYCSDECLGKNMTEEEYEKLYDEDDGETGWIEGY